MHAFGVDDDGICVLDPFPVPFSEWVSSAERYWVILGKRRSKTDKFLLMVHGTAAEVEKARDIIESTRPVTVTLHAAEVVATATS